jgi:hypothetical protein
MTTLDRIQAELAALDRWDSRECGRLDALEAQAGEEQGYVMLPDGSGEVGNCARSASYLQHRLGGRIVGFDCADNPTASVAKWTLGHSFLIVEERWLVDWWAHSYNGCASKGVFDLLDPRDAVEIAALYGDPRRWRALA